MIKSIKAREILDSKGRPTIEAELKTDRGVFKASVPSGTSEGKYEAKEVRASKAVENVNKIIAPELTEKNPAKQKEIDELMIELDGTENKSKLGANAILAVSITVCRAGAAANNISLYNHINQLSRDRVSVGLPMPCFNILEGGVHADNKLDIQEFMVVPQEKTFSENFKTGKKIYQNLKKILEKKFGKKGIKLGDEGGFAPPTSNPEEALNFLKEASLGFNMKFGLDCAASQWENQKYEIDFYQNLAGKYPLIFLEDPFSQDDWQGFQEITKKLGNKITIVGDDLLTTNIKRIKEAKLKNACNGVIIKPDQVGTVSEVIKAVKLAKSWGWKIIVSHRSGETMDDFIADLAVGVAADFIKSGAPAQKERLVKYNRLLKIEKELK